MQYLQVKWRHAKADLPVLLYSEIDSDRMERRKVEVYCDGRKDFADETRQTGTTRLGIEPLPTLDEIAQQDEFLPQEVTRAQFQQVWDDATTD